MLEYINQLSPDQIEFWKAWFGTGLVYAVISGIWLHDPKHEFAWANTIVTGLVKICFPPLMALDMIGFFNRKK
ncbi:hypothetical protein [Flavilitoribacter nigricans]|uniref:Uncharacterized protein n=1 Tax=Flavilitoribacter nigricans (strain ATCC 23147 / DSM 23189 / NBRC 102662 / NCIMB 1420 / SS-2) TaxID=1122177 RepID=A0A2D0NER2_FLAN2|nr:hypothetical protein [Flavilitoribacter nigricans]PHN06967.1 hypothetical protein CRP01_09125 [Flavilitoribacter nigricans DSM 23189 = NBRC 102662]